MVNANASASQTVDSLLTTYPVFTPQGQKLHCDLTGHDLPNRFADLDRYVKTKKFQTAWEIHQIFAEYPGIFEEFDQKHIGCKLTKTVIARDPKDIRNHIGGRKFKGAISRGVTIDENEDEDGDEEDSGESDDELQNVASLEQEEQEDDDMDADYVVERSIDIQQKKRKRVAQPQIMKKRNRKQ